MGMWLQRGRKGSGVEEVQRQFHWLNSSANTMRFAVERLFLWWKLGFLILGQRSLWHFPNIRKVRYKCAFRMMKSGSEKSDMILIFNKAHQWVRSHWSYLWVSHKESLDIWGSAKGYSLASSTRAIWNFIHPFNNEKDLQVNIRVENYFKHSTILRLLNRNLLVTLKNCTTLITTSIKCLSGGIFKPDVKFL